MAYILLELRLNVSSAGSHWLSSLDPVGLVNLLAVRLLNLIG